MVVLRLPTVGLVAAVCIAQMLTTLSFSTFAALLPLLQTTWHLSNTAAGWIGGIFFVGYTAAVPILVTLTDRIDPKRIYLISVGLTAISSFGFAALAEGFWSAMIFRGLAGVGLAGTYMPGLKALRDHIAVEHQSRATAFYISGFSVGVALSYPISAVLADWGGWPAAFAGPGTAAIMAGLIIALFLPRAESDPQQSGASALLDFRPILRNRSALAYTLCYAVHNWELFGFRTWVVAFLVFTAKLQGNPYTFLEPTIVAAAITILAGPVSILGNELSIRFGRRRTVIVIMIASTAISCAIGWTASLAYLVATFFCLIYGITVIGESASVTAGAIGHAALGRTGATMALHSTLGFAGAIFGPLAFGWILDLAGSDTVLAWSLAFAHMGVVLLAGPLVLTFLRPAPLPGDRIAESNQSNA